MGVWRSLTLNKANRKLTWQLWLFAAGSLAFGFALVPLYNVLCEVTGYGDRSKLRQAASIVEAPDETRTVTIEFISTAPTFGNWEFRPERAQLEVHPGGCTKRSSTRATCASSR